MPRSAEIANSHLTEKRHNHAEKLRSAETGRGFGWDLKSGGLRAVRVQVPPPASHSQAEFCDAAAFILDRGPMVTVDEIRALAQTLPRSYEVFVHGQIKFRVGKIVWLALSKDGDRMGCGFPREMRQAAVAAEPHKFQLPSASDMRFNWIRVCLDAIDAEEMQDLVEEAWSRAVPLYVAQEYGRTRGYMTRSRSAGLEATASGLTAD
jgi:hypothetical protein